MYIINFNKLTIYFNLIILFLISFYLINDFFKSKTSVKEKKNSEQKTHTNFSETNYKIQKDLSLININLPKLPKKASSLCAVKVKPYCTQTNITARHHSCTTFFLHLLASSCTPSLAEAAVVLSGCTLPGALLDRS